MANVYINESEPLNRASFSTLLDSGDRTQFSSGAVRDMHTGKGRCDLMPLDVIADIFNPNSVIVGAQSCELCIPCEDVSYDFFNNLHLFQLTGDTCYLHKCLDKLLSTFRDSTTVYDSLLELSKHYENGAIKYGEHNWEKGIPTHCYLDSGVRHLMKWLRGDDDEPHGRAFVWNMICLIWTMENQPQMDDMISYDWGQNTSIEDQTSNQLDTGSSDYYEPYVEEIDPTTENV